MPTMCTQIIHLVDSTSLHRPQQWSQTTSMITDHRNGHRHRAETAVIHTANGVTNSWLVSFSPGQEPKEHAVSVIKTWLYTKHSQMDKSQVIIPDQMGNSSHHFSNQASTSRISYSNHYPFCNSYSCWFTATTGLVHPLSQDIAPSFSKQSTPCIGQQLSSAGQVFA